MLSSIADDDETLEFLKKCMGNDSAKPHNSTKNELSFADLPPIADLKITVPESECVEIGAISGIVGTLGMFRGPTSMPSGCHTTKLLILVSLCFQ